MGNRHDTNQRLAEQLAADVGSFPFSFGPGRSLSVTEGMLTAAFRRALDARLIEPVAAEQNRLAFRRLQIALSRRLADEGGFQGDGLHAAVVAAAQIIEHGAEPLDFLPDCESHGREHWWTVWRLNDRDALREERYCFDCGTVETQQIGRPAPEDRA